MHPPAGGPFPTGPLRVLNLTSSDTGGFGIRAKQGFAEHEPDWTYDLVTSSQKYMRYPRDRPWADAHTLYAQCDVVHLRQSFHVVRRMLGRHPLDRPAVIHHHGTRFRTYTSTLLAEQRRYGCTGLVSTLDLWLMAPDETTWLPATYDIDWLRRHRTVDPVDPPGRPIRIAHAPTNRTVKNTGDFLHAVDRLRRDVDVELVLIERKPWSVCLDQKARADIFYDQVDLGYGNNAIEAWGMGIPVVAGAQPGTLAEMTRRFGAVPFHEATPATIYDALHALATSPTLRRGYSLRGYDHVRRWHDHSVVVPMLRGHYLDAYRRHHGQEQVGQ